MKKIFTLVLFIVIYGDSFSQNEANNWYFGRNAGVTFNSGAPVALTNGQLNTLEGCSTISDASGNLLFYTDGIKVWNRNHAVMANGNNLKGDPSSTQSGIIVPKPGSSTVYYIFTVDMQGGLALFAGGDADGVSNGFMYSEVDMSLNGGLGDIVVARKNVALRKPTTEGLSAVRSTNGVDFWVVTHGCNNNQYYAFSITAAGVNTTPVISSTGPSVSVSAVRSGAGALGYMKISPNGKRIAACHTVENNQVVLSDFNASTGVVSNSATFPILFDGESGGPYGVEFSQCNEYLYVAENFYTSNAFWGTSWPRETRIWRFDLNAGNVKTLFSTINTEENGALQLAPNGKIYIAQRVRTGSSVINYSYGNGANIHAINNPRTVGANVTLNAVNLAGRRCEYGLPPFIASYFYNSSFSTTNLATGDTSLFCFGDSVQFNGTTNAFDSIRWYFGDPSTGINNTSTLLNPKHLFSASGVFIINFYKYICGVKDSASKNITIYKYPVHTPLVNQSICSGSLVLDATSVPITSYLWSTSAITPTITVSTAGKYVVTLNNNGCKVKDSMTLTVNLPTTSTINHTICQGQSVIVGGQTFTTTQVNKIIVLANANSRGCDSTITLNLTINPKTTSSINQTICQGQSVTVGGQTFTTTQTNKIIVLTNGNSRGCDSTITLNLTVNPKTTSSINQTICQGQSVTVGGQTFNTTQVNKIIVLANANSNGCDSTITLNLTVTLAINAAINLSICQGQSVTVGGQTFSTPQVNKIITLVNGSSQGCDSVITLNLTVNLKTTSTINQSICQGQSVTVGGQTFNTTQTNKIIVLANANSNGCDSTITLNLTVNPKTTSNINQTICQGQSVVVGGQIFTTTQVNKIIVLANANSNGCDSTITLNLTVNPKTTSSINQTICQGQSVVVGGQIFTTTQTNKIIVLANANSNGCDSTITLNLTVNPKTTSSINQTICQGQSVVVGGQTFTTTQVNKIIVLANANSNSCDSTITLNLTVNPKTTSSINQTICQGQSVTVGGQTFNTTQTNKIIVLANANSNGCDSTITLNLTVNPKTTSNINQTICQGQSVTVGGQTFNTTQVNKIIVLVNANSNGCDSTITLNLNVNLSINAAINLSICQGQSVTVGGQTFSTSQVNKIITLVNGSSNGCDSIITLNLTVNPKTTSGINQTICQGQSVTVGGQTFTTTQINKIIVLANANSNGCDSTITLNLTVNPKTTSSINQTICQGQSVVVGGQTFNTTQTNKIIVLANANSNGCDSTITLNLTVNPKTTSSINQTICQGQSVTVGGQTFTTTQTNKIIVLSNANSNGCDSTITLNLTVNPKTTSSINQTICQGQSVVVGGQTFNTTQTNKIIVLANANSNGCDSTITLNLTVNPKTTSNINQTICQGQSVTVGGQIFTTTQVNKIIVLANANSNGCDSTITLNLTVNPKTTSSITQTICQGQSVTVGGQTFTTTQTNKIIVLANANSNGCDSTITLNLTVNPTVIPTVSIAAISNDICPGGTIKLVATTSVVASYQWYVNGFPAGTNSNQFSSTTLNNGDAVKVVITTAVACSSPNTATSNTINAIVNTISYTKAAPKYCINDAYLVDTSKMTINALPDSNFTIKWTNGSVITTDSTINYTVSNTANTNIPFTIKFGNNCVVNDVMNVVVYPLPVINAVVDIPRAKYEEEVQLDVVTNGNGLSYNWIPSSLVSNDSIKNPVSIIRASTLFIVNVEDKNGCKNSDSVFVELIDECKNDFIYVPTAFSPNHDGINDCFSIVSPPNLSDFKMVIFDRWGEKVFETNDKDICWDGTYKSTDVPTDSYPYIISFKCYNGADLSKKGLVSVIR